MKTTLNGSSESLPYLAGDNGRSRKWDGLCKAAACGVSAKLVCVNEPQRKGCPMPMRPLSWRVPVGLSVRIASGPLSMPFQRLYSATIFANTLSIQESCQDLYRSSKSAFVQLCLMLSNSTESMK
jgi:hypothetical protein